MGFRFVQPPLATSESTGTQVTPFGEQATCWRTSRRDSATSAETSGDHRPLETTKSTSSGSRTIPMICSEVFENQIGGGRFVQVHPLCIADSTGTEARLVRSGGAISIRLSGPS